MIQRGFLCWPFFDQWKEKRGKMLEKYLIVWYRKRATQVNRFLSLRESVFVFRQKRVLRFFTCS